MNGTIQITMPIFEFFSPDTNKIYSFYARNSQQAKLIPVCPDGIAYRMERVISRFAVTGRKENSRNEADRSDMDNPRLQAAMGELEHAISGMDDENPDPRQMGALMRKMADLSGERMDGTMEEVIRRLEQGESPERIEEELGPQLEQAMPDGDGSGEDPVGGAASGARRLRKREPERDPRLYDYPAREEGGL
jgi:hypothetical protein